MPYTAVALAGSCNAILMRYKEALYVSDANHTVCAHTSCNHSFVCLFVLLCSDGIEVIDAEGKTRGKSTVAGRMALMQVAATRVMLPLPSK